MKEENNTFLKDGAPQQEHWHFVGVGGIGMSALAQMAAAQGIGVSGSDRDSEKPENRPLFDALRRQQIAIYPQDGSFARFHQATRLIYSSAIEEGNPDFCAAAGVARMHRSEAMKYLIEHTPGHVKTIAVAGSCGKTSTTALVAETLRALHIDAGCINGGMVHAFQDEIYPGNFKPGREYFVFEADESDKSLLHYTPDFALILNIGTDHYEKTELQRMFAAFANQCKVGVVLSDEVAAMLHGMLREDLSVVTFGSSSEAMVGVTDYQVREGRCWAALQHSRLLALPGVGRHSAWNVAATAALLRLLKINPFSEAALHALETPRGVKRRFDFVGRIPESAAAVYDDYAHNPEKIACCIRAAQELAPHGKVLTVFQPHGYGPFGFMADELGRVLGEVLREQDRFFLMEPYYAGGTSSFQPDAVTVWQRWQQNACNHAELGGRDRAPITRILRSASSGNDVVLIMGARDNSLTLWAQELTRQALDS